MSASLPPKKQSTFKKRHCKLCKKPLFFSRLCFKCKLKIPNGFNLRQDDEIITAEVQRNEMNKDVFKKTSSLGILQVDTENNMFSIDRGYYRISELATYSFYSGEPRYSYGAFNNLKVYTDIYFSYTLIGQERRIRIIKKSVPCRYENTGTTVCVEPPACMQTMSYTFKEMIKSEYGYIMRTIATAQATQKN